MSGWPNIAGSTDVTTRGKPILELVHSDLPFLHETEWNALTAMPLVLGYVAVGQMISLPDMELRFAVQRYIASENEKQSQLLKMQEAHLGTLQASIRSPTGGRSRELKLHIATYNGHEKESLRRWFVEIDTGIIARQITDEAMKVAFAMSQLRGRAREWAFNSRMANPHCFPTLNDFKNEIAIQYEPPRTLHRAIAEFLELQQGKSSLHDYIQRMKFLISCAYDDPPSESTTVTHFMRGLKSGPVRDEVYRHSPDTFDEAVRLALEAEFNHRQQKFDSHAGSSNKSKANNLHQKEGPTPMEICAIDVAGSRKPKNSRSGRHSMSTNSTHSHVSRDKSNDTCHRCQQKGHWAPDCKAPPRNGSSQGRSQRPGASAPSKNGFTQ
jgi:hypothetical protein